MYRRQRSQSSSFDNGEYDDKTFHHLSISTVDIKPECHHHMNPIDTVDSSFGVTEIKIEPYDVVEVEKASTNENIYAGTDEDDSFCNVNDKCESKFLTNTIIKEELIIENESDVEDAETSECNTDCVTRVNHENQQFTKRRKKVYKNWRKDSTFLQKSEALDLIKKERIWTTYTTNKTVKGRKVLYRCKNVKSRGPQCEAGVYLLYSLDNPTVTLYRSVNRHTCDTIDSKRKPYVRRIIKPKVKQESEEVSENQKELRRRKKVVKNWQREKCFELEAEALAAVKDEQTWAKHTTNKTNKEKKVIYRCKNVKSKGLQCDAGIYLSYSSDATVTMYRSANRHTCDTIETKSKSTLNDAAKLIIRTEHERDKIDSKRKPYVRRIIKPKVKQESDEVSENPKKLRRRKKVVKNWQKEKCFDSENQALEALRFEQIWTKHTTNKTNKEKKVIYRCKNVKSKGPQCDAGIYLSYSSDATVTMYRSANRHTCDTIESKSKSTLNDAAKLIVRTEYERESKPKYIRSVLIGNGFNCNLIQINNYLAQLRRDARQSTSVTSKDFSDAFNAYCEDQQTIKMF